MRSLAPGLAADRYPERVDQGWLMSVRTMARVWADSKHSGSRLLMLLAIADFADDEGNAYPSVATLAVKCRMKPRNANVILAALRASGELQVLENEGPRGTNRYHVVLSQQGVHSLAGVGVQELAGLQKLASTPAKACSPPLQRLATEPSLNHHEPSSLARPRLNAKIREIQSKNAHPLFAEFYAAYPRKVARAAALKAFSKLNPNRGTLEAMLTSIAQQKRGDQWRRDGGQYIPYPATWLSGRRWEDQPTCFDGRGDRRGGITDPSRFAPEDYEEGATVGANHV